MPQANYTTPQLLLGSKAEPNQLENFMKRCNKLLKFNDPYNLLDACMLTSIDIPELRRATAKASPPMATTALLKPGLNAFGVFARWALWAATVQALSIVKPKPMSYSERMWTSTFLPM